MLKGTKSTKIDTSKHLFLSNLAHSNIDTNVPDIFTFSHTAVSPDGRQEVHFQLNLTMGTPVVVQQQFCGGILCFEERDAPITGTATGTITDVMTGTIEQTFTSKLVGSASSLRDWFPPNTPAHDYALFFLFIGNWELGGPVTLIDAGAVDSSIRPDLSRVTVTTFTPEPGTLLTLGSGVIFLVGFYRRQQGHFVVNLPHLGGLQHH